MKKVIFIISALALVLFLVLSVSTPPTGRQWKKWSNPLFEGWYADPEGIVIDDQLWIYPTYSKPFKEQLHLDAFSSKDLKKWTMDDYCVAYAIADSPFGPFVRENTILSSDTEDGNNRVTCIDRLEFDAEGKILPVNMH